MKINIKETTPLFWRLVFHWCFFAWIVAIGIQFGLFVRHFESGGVTPYYARPPGVEGFLPIGALASLRHLLLNGEFNSFHPAALVLLLTFIAMSLLAKKSFCSWLCPVGTVSELLWKAGRRLLGDNYKILYWLDMVMRGAKYALLLFFCKILLLDMPSMALGHFLKSPYWAMSDVKMLHFFTEVSLIPAVAIIGLAILSLFYKNFWCRYLCPYGALLGLVSMLSPMKIRRDLSSCTHCQRCRHACPSSLPVDQKPVIHSPECTGCLTCVSSCQDDALQMAPPLLQRRLPGWVFPLLVLGLYTVGVGAGMASGHWETILSYRDYMQMVPQVNNLGF